MYRHIAVGLLLLNALTPALSNACAASCALGAGIETAMLSDHGTDSAGNVMPCHADPQTPDEGGSGNDDGGSMAAMCAFAATAAISVAHSAANPVTPSARIAFVEASSPSFVSLPADKPPRT